VGIPQTTLKRYMTLLEATFMISFLPPWHRNLGKRLVKSPKILLNDTGLAADLLGATVERLKADRILLGHLLEGFVVLECQKQRTWSKTSVMLYHFRTQVGEEVDLVLENKSGELVGIEIKAAQTVTEKDFRGLKVLAELTGESFKQGIVFYTGKEIIPFGKNLFAVPVNALWEARA
jgi:predicted AAA+ superfamily ATPase